MQEILIETDAMHVPHSTEDIKTQRSFVYQELNHYFDATVTIFVLAYNNLENTKVCVESILENTKDINFQLALIDNGSTDNTLEYFRSVKYENKVIYHITKNIGGPFACYISLQHFSSKYYVLIPNDVIVTSRWLNNLLICMESDPAIGFVTPVSSNVSNLQEVNLSFSTIDEMQKKAAIFNQSDPKKWQERMRLINIVTVLKKEVIDAVGLFDMGYFHDFTEDDYSARVRRAGYKLMLCGDTFVHHNHDYRSLERKDAQTYQHSLDAGRKGYSRKFYGIDAWDDINNFEPCMTYLLSQENISHNSTPSILGIDVRCGTPILQIKNTLRTNGIFEAYTAAFTTDAKYFYDLQCVTQGHVSCDRIEYILDRYAQNSFDYVILGAPLNGYLEPLSLLRRLLEITKQGGKLLFKLQNCADIYTFFYMLGCIRNLEGNMTSNLSPESIENCLKLLNAKGTKWVAESYPLNQETIHAVENALASSGICEDASLAAKKLNILSYVFITSK